MGARSNPGRRAGPGGERGWASRDAASEGGATAVASAAPSHARPPLPGPRPGAAGGATGPMALRGAVLTAAAEAAAGGSNRRPRRGARPGRAGARRGPGRGCRVPRSFLVWRSAATGAGAQCSRGAWRKQPGRGRALSPPGHRPPGGGCRRRRRAPPSPSPRPGTARPALGGCSGHRLGGRLWGGARALSASRDTPG